MMSKERRLLERVMYRIPSAVISEHDLDLVDDIKALLAQPEQEPSDAEIITAYQMLVRRKLGLQEKNEILQLGVEE